MVIFVWAGVLSEASRTTDAEKRILENLGCDTSKAGTNALVDGLHMFSLAQAFTPGSRIK
jgi:hypothetical protein